MSGRSALLGRALPPGEAARKLVHAGMGLFALALPFLTWWQAAVCALAAFCHNWLLLPRIIGHRMSSARSDASDQGVLLYPIVVGALILVFFRDMTAAAVGWGFLAFGDAAAGVAGMKWGRRALPWNGGKTWAGSLGGFLGASAGGTLACLAFVLGRGATGDDTVFPAGVLVGIIVAAAGYALVEGAPLAVDDNLLAPVLAAIVFHSFQTGGQTGSDTVASWAAGPLVVLLAVNAFCALAAAWKRVLSAGGIAAAFVLGITTWGFGGFRLWLVLLVFLGLGTAFTRIGWKRKTALGIAEADEGRRGLGNVAAKGVVVLASSVVAALTDSPAWMVIAVAALAAALADTAGSEVGKAYGGAAYLLPALRRVPAGTDGAVSAVGTAAAALAAMLLSGLAGWLGVVEPHAVWLCGGVGFLASLAEGRFPRAVGHNGVNLTLTLVSAAAAGAAIVVLGW